MHCHEHQIWQRHPVCRRDLGTRTVPFPLSPSPSSPLETTLQRVGPAHCLVTDKRVDGPWGRRPWILSR